MKLPISSKSLILSDTNVAYKLYFFVEKNIVARNNIQIPNIGNLEFHPIVLGEVDQHIIAYKEAKAEGLSMAGLEIPAFFDTVGIAYAEKIYDFVAKNVCSRINKVDTRSIDFIQKRKTYEDMRKTLQQKWKSEGVQGKKVRSTPSTNDYSLLYSADTLKHHLLSNDEILVALAEQFLLESCTFKTEDIIHAILQNDPTLKKAIEDVVDTLESVGETIIRPRLFRLPS